MVPQVIDKFNEYSSIQHQLSIKNVSLMDLLNTSKNLMSKSSENSLFTKERESTTDPPKQLGTKRQQPDSPSSPSSNQPSVNKGINGHIVYVRRKLDTERGKKNILNIAGSSSSSILSRKSKNEETKDPEVQQDNTQMCSREVFHSNGLEPNDLAVTATTNSPDVPQKSNQESNALVVPLRPSNQDCKALVVPERSSDQGPNAPNDSQRSSDQECKPPLNAQKFTDQDCKAVNDSQRLSYQHPNASIDPHRSTDQAHSVPANPQKLTDHKSKEPVDAQSSINQDWKERYLKLQNFLKDCDRSSQEDYKRMLRSLTAADRSKHALELEKRALHLLLEEGKELHRMQVLNVIGEAASQDLASPLTTSASLSQSQRMETSRNPKSPFLRSGH